MQEESNVESFSLLLSPTQSQHLDYSWISWHEFLLPDFLMSTWFFTAWSHICWFVCLCTRSADFPLYEAHKASFDSFSTQTGLTDCCRLLFMQLCMLDISRDTQPENNNDKHTNKTSLNQNMKIQKPGFIKSRNKILSVQKIKQTPHSRFTWNNSSDWPSIKSIY